MAAENRSAGWIARHSIILPFVAANLRRCDNALEASAKNSFLYKFTVRQGRFILNAFKGIFTGSVIVRAALARLNQALYYILEAVSDTAADIYDGSAAIKAIERAVLNSRWIK